MKLIPLTQNKHTQVDDEMFDFLSKRKWMYHPKGYAYRTEWNHGKKKHIFMHNLIMGVERGIDHWNRDGLDNQCSNLRLATKSQNKANSPKQKNNRHTYKGVHKDGNLWYAQIWYQKKCYKSSGVPNERWAAYLYDFAALEAFGEFAKTNFSHPLG